MKMMLAMAVALANIASMDRNALPEGGHPLWSTNVMDNSGHPCKLEVRIFPDFSYRVVLPHDAGHTWIQSRSHEFLDGAIAEALQYRHDLELAATEVAPTAVGQDRAVAIKDWGADFFPTPTHLFKKMTETACAA